MEFIDILEKWIKWVGILSIFFLGFTFGCLYNKADMDKFNFCIKYMYGVNK